MDTCNTCVNRWLLASIQPCRSCKNARYGGTEDNYKKDKDENIMKK